MGKTHEHDTTQLDLDYQDVNHKFTKCKVWKTYMFVFPWMQVPFSILHHDCQIPENSSLSIIIEQDYITNIVLFVFSSICTIVHFTTWVTIWFH